jgi:hypothetical protein
MDVVKLMRLRKIITNAYYIETQLEHFNEFMSKLKIKNQKYLDVIKKISKDSNKHRTLIENIVEKIEGIDLDDIRYKSAHMDLDDDLEFKRMNEDEIFIKLLENENQALEYYLEIKKDYFKENENLLQSFNFLVEEEKKHIGMIETVKPKSTTLQ